jgi:hypothetical protein
MKTSRLLCSFALLAVAGAGALRGFDPTKPFPKTEVVFFEPEKFTDVRDHSGGDSESERNEVLSDLRTYFVKQSARLMAAGQVLKITVTDVDLAGDFEPWHAIGGSDIRVVRDIYPPRITLAFQLTDADGSILAQGDRTLTDMNFMQRLSIERDDPRRHEKALIDDWLHREFGARKK